MRCNFLSVLIFTLFFTACSKDDDGKSGNSYDFDGTIETIRDFVGSDLLDTIVDMGMVINPGTNPPDVKGTYLASPLILIATNVPDDYELGFRFPDSHIEIRNQRKFEVDFYEDHANTTGLGEGSFVSGDGDKFSLFVQVETTLETGEVADLIYIISGRISPEGIHDYKNALFMVDDRGNAPPFLKTGEGRVVEDGDGLAERQTSGLKKTPVSGNSLFLKKDLL